MKSAPVPDPAQASSPNDLLKSTAADRFRLERLWWTMTYVLIEAWRHRSNEAQMLFAALPPTAALETSLTDLETTGVLAKIRTCRDYMCHRDARGYWDDGRMAPHGHLTPLLKLHEDFSTVFLAALDHLKNIAGP